MQLDRLKLVPTCDGLEPGHQVSIQTKQWSRIKFWEVAGKPTPLGETSWTGIVAVDTLDVDHT